MSTSLRAFRHRNYRLFFAGQGVSLVGTWMQQVAQGWLVLQLTGDPFWIGLVAAAQFAPVIVLGLVGGLLADHLPKRRTLMATQIASMILALVLFGLTATGLVEVWHVIVLALGLGLANAFDMPSRQAFPVEMVGREDVTSAVGLNSAQFNASRILGPAVAGVLISTFDLSVAFLLNALSYIAVIAAYAAMRADELRPPPSLTRPTTLREVASNLAEGTRYVRRTPLVLMALVVMGLAATFGMNFQVLVPPLADHVLGVGAAGFGFLLAASGIGSTVAALTLAFSGRSRPILVSLGAIALGLGSIVLAWTTWFPLSLASMAFAGAGAIAMFVTSNTTIQLSVPDHLRGRVMSLYTTSFSASVPVGGLLFGAIASAAGAQVALAVGGVLTVSVGLGAFAWARRIGAGRPEVVEGTPVDEASRVRGIAAAVRGLRRP
jgi:MFS family permease